MAIAGLPTLLDKAVRDSGYDLLTSVGDGWASAKISGTQCEVWIRSFHDGAFFATPESGIAEKLGVAADFQGQPPSGSRSVGRVESAGELHRVLQLIRALQSNPITKLLSKVEARLASIPTTERTAEVRQRIGQDVFREALLEVWDERCALTGVPFPSVLLRASHAKPWAKSDDSERLDPLNGLLLSVHFDALFDDGLMTFRDDGLAMFSPVLSDEVRQSLGIGDAMRLRFVTPGHLKYLQFHRTNVAKFPAG